MSIDAQTILAALGKAIGEPTDWEQATLHLSHREETGAEAIRSLIAGSDGDGWVEYTDRVAYRRDGGSWTVPLGTEAGECVPDGLIPLAGELVTPDGSLAFHHHHGDTWRVTETGAGKAQEVLARDEERLSILRGMVLTYRVFWSVEEGGVVAAAFAGFGKLENSA